MMSKDERKIVLALLASHLSLIRAVTMISRGDKTDPQNNTIQDVLNKATAEVEGIVAIMKTEWDQ